MRRLSMFVATAALVLASLFAMDQLSATRAQGEDATASHPLVGSWLVSVTLEGEEPGAALPASVTSLVTFFADGNVLVANAGQLPPLPPGAGLFFTEGHGQWIATGASGAEATFVSLVLDQTGGPSSTVTAHTTLEVDASGDAYTGTASYESTSLTGGSMGTQQVNVEATRIQVAPMATPES